MFMGSRESVDNMQHLSVAATDQRLDAFPWGGMLTVGSGLIAWREVVWWDGGVGWGGNQQW